MNPYDRDDGFRRFTLEEVNQVLPDVIVKTERAVMLLKQAKDAFEAVSNQHKNLEDARTRFDEECEYILDVWSRDMVGLGGYPKGYFTVDFKSPVPDTLFCWTFGEQMVSHTHKIFESFKDRVPIKTKPTIGFQDSLN